MAHSVIPSPALTNESLTPQSSTRKLRTRAPRSYVLPGLVIDDLDSLTKADRIVQTEKQLTGYASTVTSRNEPTSIAPTSSSKPTGRLSISRQHRPSTPPPFPSCSLTYLQSDKFPSWLLGDSMIKSSPQYSPQEAGPASPIRHSSNQPTGQTSPVRSTDRSLLSHSPSKFRSSLNRHPSTSSLRLIHQSTHRSTSPDEELEARRERFWECYEYDTTAPHLQPRYFDKPLPLGEQWSDLDIQNYGVIPAPIDGSPTIHLFEVFAPTAHDSVSEGTNDEEPLNKQVSYQNISAIPFGFHILPHDYNGHQKQ